MKLKAAILAATTLALAGPALAADMPGWRQHHGHHTRHHGYHAGPVYAEHVVEIVEYREPYLPRGVLYNAPPLPVSYSYGHGSRYREVISAKY